MKSEKSKSLESFTVVELLVVCAIVFILVGVLVPSLQTAKQKASRIKCTSNLRQVGTAIEYYKEDNDQYYPLRPPTAYTEGNQSQYMNVLGSNYMRGNWEVFRCPLNKNTWALDQRTNTLGGRMDYQMNSGVWGMQAHGKSQFARIISPPNLCVVIYDWPGPNFFSFAANAESPHPDGGINAYFADGHVAYITAIHAHDMIEGRSDFYDWGLPPP